MDGVGQSPASMDKLEPQRPILYFKSASEAERAFYRVRISDRKHERVTGLNELYRLGLGVGQG